MEGQHQPPDGIVGPAPEEGAAEQQRGGGLGPEALGGGARQPSAWVGVSAKRGGRWDSSTTRTEPAPAEGLLMGQERQPAGKVWYLAGGGEVG